MSDEWNENYQLGTTNAKSNSGRGRSGCRVIILALLVVFIIVALVAGLIYLLRPDQKQSSTSVSSDDTILPDPTAGPATATIAITVTATSPPVADATTPISFSGRIVLTDQDKRLRTVAADGSRERVLTVEGTFFTFPVWSPTGDSIAAIGDTFEGAGVYLTEDRDNNVIRRVYQDQERAPIYLYWSPDGRQVSFIASHRDGLALYLAPADEVAGSEILTTGGPTFFWQWLPSGQQVLIHTGFTASRNDVTELAFVPLEETVEQTIVPQTGFFQAPAVSANGEFYAFSDSDPTGGRWLIIRDFSSGQQARLAFHLGVIAMGWSPAQNQLAYISPSEPARTFYGPLQLLGTDRGETQVLVDEDVLAFFWSPDGRQIAYLTLGEDLGGQVAGLPSFSFVGLSNGSLPRGGKSDLSRASRLVKSAKQQDDRIFLNLSTVDVVSGERNQLYTFEPSYAFLNQFLPFFDQYALSHRLWSPDSDALVVAAHNADDGDLIVVVPAEGGEPFVVGHGGIGFWSHQ